MSRPALFALGMMFMASSSFSQEDGNEALVEALGRKDCTVVPLWPQGIGPGETKPQLAEIGRASCRERV